MEDAEDAEDANDAPNNYVCFTEEDFLAFREGMNDSTLHHSKYMKVLRDIRSLIGTEVVVESAKDGNISWRVVEEREEDEFIGEMQRENEGREL